MVEFLPFIREAWVQILATPTEALEKGLNLYLLLGPYLDGAPACYSKLNTLSVKHGLM